MRFSRCLALPVLLTIAMMISFVPARAENEDPLYEDAARYIHQWNRMITDIMIDDGWTPPIATRHYAYANIAAYEASRPGFPMCRTLDGQLNGLTGVPKPDMTKKYDWRVAAITGYKMIASNRLFRSKRSDSLYAVHMAEIGASGVPADVIERSRIFGEAVGNHVINWMKSDGYTKITAIGRYVIPKGRGLWEPTEPDFKDPADPFWGDTMRTMALTSGGHFKCDPPVSFDDKQSSDFYKQAMEVYTIGRNLTDEQRLIAMYWNDNPVTSLHYGHVMYNVRWMTPPGHWINITSQACRMKNLGMMEALETYTLVSLAMYDGFISCWHAKFSYNVMRPVTYIHRYIDSTWQPLIQTPPFPEHTSGHSTISAAAATVLTRLLGEFPFEDSTSTQIQLPTRKFESFNQAAAEAAMSRLYGGIHYRRGNDAGAKNGARVAEYIMNKVRTRM